MLTIGSLRGGLFSHRAFLANLCRAGRSRQAQPLHGSTPHIFLVALQYLVLSRTADTDESVSHATDPAMLDSSLTQVLRT